MMEWLVQRNNSLPQTRSNIVLAIALTTHPAHTTTHPSRARSSLPPCLHHDPHPMTSSLSTVVSSLVRATMGTSVPSTVADDDLDRHVAELILREAKKKAERYGTQGIRAFLPAGGGSDSPAPRTNKRFLSSIIKTTEDHNKTVLRAQAIAAQEQKREREEEERRARRRRAEEAVEAERMRRGRREESWDRWDGRREGKRRRDWEDDGERERRHREKRRPGRKEDAGQERESSRSPRRSKRRSRRDRNDEDGETRHKSRKRSRSRSRRKAQKYALDDIDSDTARDSQAQRRSTTVRSEESLKRRRTPSRSPSPPPPPPARSPSPVPKHRSKRTKRTSLSPRPPSGSPPPLPSGPPPPLPSPGPFPPPHARLPSKMDKYFEESYDPRLDVAPLAVPTVPKTGLINDAEYAGWDAMLELLRVRREDKEEKRRLERLGVSMTSDRGLPPPMKKREDAEVSVMEIQYKKRGSVREWDLGKEGLL
ncbi:hypothetical protein H2248_001414 [Termitomyces sp. 'cryptogamus']|nr:hypothetical protein H2248_001414 [Termitomyces sp. 'cryptogamus']